jgi:hypothetical protein
MCRETAFLHIPESQVAYSANTQCGHIPYTCRFAGVQEMKQCHSPSLPESKQNTPPAIPPRRNCRLDIIPPVRQFRDALMSSVRILLPT